MLLATVMAALVLSTASVVFAAAGALRITNVVPASGSTNIPVQNVGIKLYFDGNVTDPSVWGANQKQFQLTDSAGKPIPGEDINLQVIHGSKENNYILVVVQPKDVSAGVPGSLQQKTEYKLVVSGDLADASGRTLGEPQTISFTTLDMSAQSKISVFLMIGMLVAVIALMFITQTRKVKAEAEAAALLKANPYHIAKDRGISVKEAEELIEKAKEKNRIKLEKTGGKAPVPEAEKQKQGVVPQLGAGKKKKTKKTWKVKGPRPVSAGGSAYLAKRKAEAEAKAKAEAAKKAARARQQGGGGGGGKKSTKGKGKKK